VPMVVPFVILAGFILGHHHCGPRGGARWVAGYAFPRGGNSTIAMSRGAKKIGRDGGIG